MCSTWPRVEPAGERRVRRLHPQMQVAADVSLACVAHQRAGQQPRLAQNLESVAYAHHQSARVGKLPHALHDRRKARDRPGPQVVAIGKSARDQDCVAAFQVVRLMPQIRHRRAHHRAECVVRILIAVGTGKHQNAELHSSRLAFPLTDSMCIAHGHALTLAACLYQRWLMVRRTTPWSTPGFSYP